MRLIVANNATSPLQIAVGVSDTDIYVDANDADKFPNPIFGQEYFKVTLDNRVTAQIEITHCVRRVGNRLYVERAKENTTAKTFETGTLVSNRVTRDTLTELLGAAFDWGSQYLGGLAYFPTVDNNGDPVTPGCMFYYTLTKTVYVWDGIDWRTFDKPAPASGQRLVYVKTTPVSQLSGVDAYGNTMNLSPSGLEPVEVYKNGIRLTQTLGGVSGDYTVDYTNNKILLSTTTSGTYHVDIYTPASELALGGVSTTKFEDLSAQFNGVTKTFDLKNGASGDAVVTTTNATIIALDGLVQEPGVAYTVSGSQIIFTTAPAANTPFWGLYNTSGDAAATIYVGETAPQNAFEGMVWYDKSAGVARPFIYIIDTSGDGFWVDFAPDRFGENALDAVAVTFDPLGTNIDPQATNVQAMAEDIDSRVQAIENDTSNSALIGDDDTLTGRMKLAVVTALPAQPDADTIYFIKSS